MKFAKSPTNIQGSNKVSHIPTLTMAQHTTFVEKKTGSWTPAVFRDFDFENFFPEFWKSSLVSKKGIQEKITSQVYTCTCHKAGQVKRNTGYEGMKHRFDQTVFTLAFVSLCAFEHGQRNVSILVSMTRPNSRLDLTISALRRTIIMVPLIYFHTIMFDASISIMPGVTSPHAIYSRHILAPVMIHLGAWSRSAQNVCFDSMRDNSTSPTSIKQIWSFSWGAYVPRQA